MSTDLERETAAALHRVAEQLPPLRLDLGEIRRGGRRRRIAAFTAAALATAVLTGGAIVGVQHLPSAPSRIAGRPAASASPPAPATSPPRPTASPHPSATGPAVPAAAMADVRAFYSRYAAAAKQGQAAADALISSYAAGWYAPILEAPAQGYAPDCFAYAAHSGLDYAPAGLVGGQAIIVVSSSDASGQALYAVVTADPGTGKITGIACTIGGQPVTATGARDSASGLYQVYLNLRRQGASAQDAVTHIASLGNLDGPYLLELQRAAAWPELTYDPLLCTSAGLPNVSVTATTVVAGGSAGVVELTPSVGQPIVAVVVLGAQGWAVAGVACHQP
jgi:hypothetical protein